MRVNLSSLAPDTFILGPTHLLEQFYPKKILNISSSQGKVKEGIGCDNCLHGRVSKLWGGEIHLTSSCSLSCPYCSYSKRNRDRCELSELAAKKLLESFRSLGVSSIIFSGGGDPLSWQSGRFGDLLKLCSDFKLSIATNGISLSEVLDKDALDSLGIIQIHINGYNAESYQKSTRTKLFDKFVANLRWMFATRQAKKTQITGKILLTNENYRDVLNYLEFCAQFPFDVIVIKLAGNFESGQNVELNQNDKAELSQLIYASSIIDKYPAAIDSISTDENSVELPLPAKCWVVEHGLYVLVRSNGSVFPCVTSPYTDENSIGNINEKNFNEIWLSKRHRVVQDKLHADMRSSTCNLKICRHMRYNFFIDDDLCVDEAIKSLPNVTEGQIKLL